MKRFGLSTLKIAILTTILTFIGLLFINAGRISPRPAHAHDDGHAYGYGDPHSDGGHEDIEVWIEKP